MRFLSLFVGALLLGLTACYSPTTMNIKLDGIRTIAITEIEEPAYFNIIAVSHRLPKRDVQGYFGFGGAFISVSAERAMFSQLMASQNFRVGSELQAAVVQTMQRNGYEIDRKSTRLNSSHLGISYAVFCLKKKKKKNINPRI